MNALEKRLALAVAGCALVAGAWSRAPADPVQGVEIQATHVAGPVHMLAGRGGNIGVCAGPEGVVLVDDQFEDMVPRIRAAVAEISREPIAFVVNTHHHGDHTGGNPILGESAPILAHENVRLRLQQPDREGRPPTAAMLASGLPVLTYADAVVLHANGETIRVEHFPRSHTDGDSAVFFETSNVVHTGDLFFAGRFPFVDLDGGGSVKGLIDSVSRILDRIDADTRVIPGHGPLSSRADLEAYRSVLSDCWSRVASALAEGKSAKDMKRAKLLGDLDAWGQGFIQTDAFIDTLVREQSGR